MKSIVLFLAALCCVPTLAMAGPNAGGAVTLHWNPGIAYTPESVWVEGGLTSCAETITEAPAASSLPTPPEDQRQIWFAYAVFAQGSSPRLRGLTFGINYTNLVSTSGIHIDWWRTPPGSTEITTPSPAWPLPNSGTSLAFGSTMTALANEIYVFTGYGSSGQIFSLTEHPTHASQFGDDATPPRLDTITGFGSLGFGVNGQRACAAPLGACCRSNGSCEVRTRTECESSGGIYQGDEVSCLPNPCPPPSGACCFPDGSCRFLTYVDCLNAGGAWQGEHTDCEPNACPQPGACCDAQGICRYVFPSHCGTGDFRPGVSCDPNPCPQPGACCYADGSCNYLLEVNCTSGNWAVGVSCTPSPCPQPSAACCFPDGACEFVTQVACAGQGGNWLGFGSSCEPNSCPQPGACCDAQGYCTFVMREQCRTGDFRQGVACDPNPCPQPGACCYPNGSCQFVFQHICPTGAWNEAVPCDPNPCPQPLGACCYPDDHCESVLQANCPTGEWQMLVPCTPDPCASGACCSADGHCTFVEFSECPTSVWLPGAPCDPNPCPQPPPPGACCYANGFCTFVTQATCPTNDWRAGVPCDPNPCPHSPTPCDPHPGFRRGALVVTGEGGNDLSNHAQPIAKGTLIGDHMGDTRDGGESWADACDIVSLPFSDTGATCDNVDDITLPCASSAAPDVVYRFTATSSGYINVSLCGSAYDTALGIYDANQNNIACNDDFCGLQSEVENFQVESGQIYYFVVDGYSDNCGSYMLNVTANAPCETPCPTGAMLEGEPPCHDDYVDSYNGGCSSSGWWVINDQGANSAVVCGKSGNYLYNGLSYRDTDWYSVLGAGRNMTATVRAEFPVQFLFIYGTDCDNLGYDLITAAPCQDAVLSHFVAQNAEVWLWVGPSQFLGVPCESDYVLFVEGLGGTSTPVEKTSWGAIKSRFR